MRAGVPLVLLISVLFFPWWATYIIACITMFFSLGILPLLVIFFLVYSVSWANASLFAMVGIGLFFGIRIVRGRLFGGLEVS